MAVPKTRPTDQDVTAFLDAVEHPRMRQEGHVLRALMERVTQQCKVPEAAPQTGKALFP